MAVRVLVLGGYGAVGELVVASLRASGYVAHSAGRDAARADRYVDLRMATAGELASVVSGYEVVINASGTEDPALVARVTEAGAAFVDITASRVYMAAVERLDPPRPVLLGVGVAPGLSNLLAADLLRRRRGPLDIAVVLGGGEAHGLAATRWVGGLLGSSFPDPETGAAVRNFVHHRRVNLPARAPRTLYHVDFADQHILTRDFASPVRTWFALDSRVATLGLAALTWMPRLRGLLTRVPSHGSDGWMVLARPRGGQPGELRWATGNGQSAATADVTAAVLPTLTELHPGVHHLHQVTTLEDLALPVAISTGRCE